MIGRKVGRLTIIEKLHKDAYYNFYYRCLCECGNTKIIRGDHLKYNRIFSCGCYGRERSRDSKLIDITGRRFGRLRAIRRSPIKSYSSSKWYCVCDCGNVTNVSINNLMSGGTKSCGCLVGEFIGNLNRKPSTQLGFACYSTHAERLKSGGEEVKLDEEVEDTLLVRCFQSNCRKWFRPTPEQARRRIQFITGVSPHESRFYCSDGCKSECSIYRTSEKALLNKINGRKSRHRSMIQKELAKIVFERDGNQCVICGSGEKLHCHHILPSSTNPIESADVDNCVTLCKKCHDKSHHLPGCNYHELRECI